MSFFEIAGRITNPDLSLDDGDPHYREADIIDPFYQVMDEDFDDEEADLFYLKSANDR